MSSAAPPGQHPDNIPPASRQHRANVLSIAKFDQIFIKSDSRKIMERNRPLAWVSHPTEFTSRGYNELLDGHNSIMAMAVYGVFLQLVKLSVQSGPYGVLQHSDGSAFNVGYISRTIGVDRELIAKSIDILTEIRWLIPAIPPVSGQHPDNIPPVSGLQTDVTDVTDRQRGAAPARSTSSKTKTEAKPSTVEEWCSYGIDYGKSKPLATSQDRLEESFNHYAANGWKQNNGRPIRDWQAACRNAVAYHHKWETPNSQAEDDWAFVLQTVRVNYHPDLRNADDLRGKLTIEQFEAAKTVGLSRIASCDQWDKQTPEAYRTARKVVAS